MPTQTVEYPSFALTASKGFRRSRTWYNTPNFKSLSSWDKPINLYTDYPTKVSVSYWSGTTEVRLSDGYTTHVYSPQYPLTLQGAFDRFLTYRTSRLSTITSRINAIGNECLIQTLVKVSDSKANLAVTAAEATKTSSMILETANRIDRAYRAFRRGNLREVARQLNLSPKTAHKNWLAYKYGWMPLLMEVKGAAEFFAQQVSGGRANRFVVSHKITREVFSDKTVTPYVPYGGSVADASDIETLKVTYTSHHKIWCEMTSSTLSAAQQVGLTNPALVAWELVPYSFVFDWFISVGDYLVAVSALHGISVKKAMKQNITKWEYSFSRPNTTTRINNGWSYTNTPWSCSVDSYTEYGRSSFSPSVANLRPVVNDAKLTFQRLVSSLALVRARFH